MHKRRQLSIDNESDNEEFPMPPPLTERLKIGKSSPITGQPVGRGLLRQKKLSHAPGKHPTQQPSQKSIAHNTQRPVRKAFRDACISLGVTEEFEEQNDDNCDDTVEAIEEYQMAHVLPQGEIEIGSDEGEINLFSECSSSDSESSSDDHNSSSYHSDIHSKVGVIYSREPIPDRRRNRNILTQRPRFLVSTSSPLDSFLLFLPEEITRTILMHTNRKAAILRHQFSTHFNICSPLHKYNFTLDELMAGIGILLRAGKDRDNRTDLNELWNHIEGRHFFKACMSCKRFKFLLQ